MCSAQQAAARYTVSTNTKQKRLAKHKDKSNKNQEEKIESVKAIYI
jgi:hypothetical protein